MRCNELFCWFLIVFQENHWVLQDLISFFCKFRTCALSFFKRTTRLPSRPMKSSSDSEIHERPWSHQRGKQAEPTDQLREPSEEQVPVTLRFTAPPGWPGFSRLKRKTCVFFAWSRFYGVLLSFTGFWWVLLGFYWILPSITGFCWVLLDFTGFYWISLGFTGFH